VGDLGGEPMVASPIYKHHYSVISGRCLEDAAWSVPVYPARLVDGEVWIKPVAQLSTRPAGPRRVVVIGNGMAAMRTVEELIAAAPRACEITVFGTEQQGCYNRVLLSPVLAGEKRVAEIHTHPPQWYADHGISLHSGDSVVQIDRQRRTVRSSRGVVVSYDRLLLATGSAPLELSLPGIDLPGVMAFRDLADVNAMLAAAGPRRRAVIIGGGVLGLEAANGLLKQGMDVTVVHVNALLMNRQLDAEAAGLLREELSARGLQFRMPARAVAILGSDRVTAVRLEEGTELPADLVVVAVGVRPNIQLAQQAGLRCDRGILVDDTLQTFDPAIYAVGECVQHRGSTYGLVAPLFEQARVCAMQLAEAGTARYRGSKTATQLKVTGIDVFSAGEDTDSALGETLVLRDPRRGIYKRLVLVDNRVRGAVLYGDTRDGAWYFDLIKEGRDIGPLRDRLLLGEAHCQPPH
jgi:nitrite reductase (NADH) large subunit